MAYSIDIYTSGDTDADAAIIITSPNGTLYRLLVDDSGVLTTTQV